jgi:hypothetical protein
MEGEDWIVRIGCTSSSNQAIKGMCMAKLPEDNFSLPPSRDHISMRSPQCMLSASEPKRQYCSHL